MRMDGMGRKRIVGLEWLDPINTEQRRWADGYLRAKGLERLFYYSDENQPKELPSHEDMQRAGMKIEQEGGARELFRDMKDAWRQEKSRNKKKETGRQVCAFTFSTTTKNSLQEMAMEQGTSATELLETLISKAHKAHVSKAKKQKSLQAKPEKTASNTFAGGRQPSVGGTETAQGPASLDENAQIELEATSGPQEAIGTASNVVVTAPEQMSVADNQVPAMQDDALASYPHEQTDDTQIDTPGPRPQFPRPRKKKAFVMKTAAPSNTDDEAPGNPEKREPAEGVSTEPHMR